MGLVMKIIKLKDLKKAIKKQAAKLKESLELESIPESIDENQAMNQLANIVDSLELIMGRIHSVDPSQITQEQMDVLKKCESRLEELDLLLERSGIEYKDISDSNPSLSN